MAQLLSVGTVIDRAWSHYTKHFLELMTISSWLLILAVINIVTSWLSPSTAMLNGQSIKALSTMQMSGIIIYGLTFFVMAPILSIWISNQLIKTTDQQLSGGKMSSKAISTFAWKHFFPRALVGLMSTVMILSPFLLFLPGAGTMVASSLLQSSSLSLLSTLLIFLAAIASTVGCVFLAIRLIFSPFALLLNNQRGRRALQASTALAKGRFWSVAFRVVIPAVVFYIGMTTVQVVIIFFLRTIILSVAGLNVELAAQLFNMGQGTIFILLSALVSPLIISANTIVYRDLNENR